VAGGTAAALADALTGADLATRSDLARLEARMAAGFDTLGASFDSKLELLRHDLTIKLGGMIFIRVGVILAAMRLMRHP
jgi:hypothetical protein